MSGAALTAHSERPSLLSLARVEARKMLDTRSGLWLLALAALAAAAAVVAEVATGNREPAFDETFVSAMVAGAVLLPIVAILLVTGEWSQRTALNTFVLVPVRERVIAAKFLAVVGLLVAMTLLCLLLAAIGTAVDGGEFSFDLDSVGRVVLYVFLVLMFGFALAAVLMNTAAAIVLYFIAPVIVAAIGAISERINDAAAWIDPGIWSALSESTTKDWGKIATAAIAWIVIPIVLGMLRLQRRDVS